MQKKNNKQIDTMFRLSKLQINVTSTIQINVTSQIQIDIIHKDKQRHIIVVVTL